LLLPILAPALSALLWAQESPRRDLAWVEQRIRELQPRPEEKRFDRIGWLTDIRAAEKLGREHGRPVFLFTHDGRMATGRC
jgi:hypothetical protein